MVVESLSAELERLYELEELKSLSSGLLGLDPNDVGGSSAKASFARALAQRCLEIDALDALVDAAQASRRPLPVELVKKLRHGSVDSDERPRDGDEIEDVLILKELGSGATGNVLRVRRGSEDLRLRRLSREFRARRREVQRYFAAARIIGGVTHPGLPVGISAGALDAGARLVGVCHDYVEGEPLSKIIAERGGRHLNELLPLLWAIVEALSALHAEGLCHGALHAGNVLVTDPTPTKPSVVLLDAGAQHLRPGLFGLGTGTIPVK